MTTTLPKSKWAYSVLALFLQSLLSIPGWQFTYKPELNSLYLANPAQMHLMHNSSVYFEKMTTLATWIAVFKSKTWGPQIVGMRNVPIPGFRISIQEYQYDPYKNQGTVGELYNDVLGA